MEFFRKVKNFVTGQVGGHGFVDVLTQLQTKVIFNLWVRYRQKQVQVLHLVPLQVLKYPRLELLLPIDSLSCKMLDLVQQGVYR